MMQKLQPGKSGNVSGSVTESSIQKEKSVQRSFMTADNRPNKAITGVFLGV